MARVELLDDRFVILTGTPSAGRGHVWYGRVLGSDPEATTEADDCGNGRFAPVCAVMRSILICRVREREGYSGSQPSRYAVGSRLGTDPYATPPSIVSSWTLAP
jgi:hypothetical protein